MEGEERGDGGGEGAGHGEQEGVEEGEGREEGGEEGSGEGEIRQNAKGLSHWHQHLPPASRSPGLTSNAVFK